MYFCKDNTLLCIATHYSCMRKVKDERELRVFAMLEQLGICRCRLRVD